ncbi:MAG: DNA-directed DNA polymerase [archaeon]
MEFEFVPVDYDCFDFEGRNYVRMIGRDGDGKRVCVVDFHDANFYVVLKKGADVKKIVKKIEGIKVERAGRVTRVLRTEVLDKKFLGKSVKAVRVFVTNHKDAHDVASAIGDLDGVDKRREYDIPLVTKYIKESGVEPLRCYRVSGQISDFRFQISDKIVCYLAEKIEPIKDEKDFVPKVLAYDIETNDREIGKGDVLMVSLYGDGIKKVLTWKKCKDAPDYVEFCESEGKMIERFVECVNNYGPDILTGYFSDGFDLPYLKMAADKNGVEFGLGVDGRGPLFSRGRIPSGRIAGIVHIDLYRFVDAVFSQYLQSETLSLNEVAKELAGEEKEDFDFSRLGNMKNSDWHDLFSYNLQDSVVTYKLMEKVWPDILEFGRIMREPLFDVTRDRMATHVENYILHNLDRFGEIVEKRPMYDEIGERRAMEKYEGAFVFEPKPGLYENLVMFDFTSMYASVIVSYNLSKATLIEGNKFEKKKGFFAEMLEDIISRRKKYKKELAKNPTGMLRARSNAYKLLANAAYGYQGFFGARYYCREAAAATARLAKENILSAIEKIKKAGYTIVYSDTDSIAFLQGDKTKKDILKFLGEINESLPGIMELDLEDFYRRGLFVLKRGGVGGAKKKYALVDERGKIKIRGFETVRRDWCRLTRNLQSEVLSRILEDGDEKRALKVLEKVVDDLRGRKVGMDELMIRTQLRRPLGEYVAEGPHVVAAKKMEAAGVSISSGMLIEYFIGEGGVGGRGKKSGSRGKIGDKVCLAGDKVGYDVDYYLNNQVLPSVENIFEVFGVDVRAVVEGSEQKKLF